MIVKQEFHYKCKLCQAPVTLYEYEGLEGGKYGNHYCDQIRQAYLDGSNVEPIDYFEEQP